MTIRIVMLFVFFLFLKTMVRELVLYCVTPDRTEPDRVEPDRTEPHKTEPNRVDPK